MQGNKATGVTQLWLNVSALSSPVYEHNLWKYVPFGHKPNTSGAHLFYSVLSQHLLCLFLLRHLCVLPDYAPIVEHHPAGKAEVANINASAFVVGGHVLIEAHVLAVMTVVMPMEQILNLAYHLAPGPGLSPPACVWTSSASFTLSN